jgi:hypothetical protein
LKIEITLIRFFKNKYYFEKQIIYQKQTPATTASVNISNTSHTVSIFKIDG